VTAPKTWAQLTKAAGTLKASGTPAYSLCGASGWTLTDLFENIYLRTFGPAKYQSLSEHKTKWTDPTVKTALTTMGQIIGDSSNLAGGSSGALQTDFPTCVTDAFSTPSKGAIVFEADFVGGAITSSTKAKPGTDFNAAVFPTITPGANSTAVEIGGDLLVAFRDNPAIEAFVKFLATAPAAEAWAKIGGFGTGNKHVPASIYPDAITRATEAPLGTAKSVVFDMSDNQPPSFGATTGQGEWGIFQKFLQSPKDVAGIQKQLETAAAAAYKKGK
jgi:alpha-glucoside transport system substrate-binding protein